MVKVDKGLVVPVRKGYPYRDMEVGDSFLVIESTVQLVCNANWRAGKRLGMKFIARQMPEGIRVWRTM